MKIVIPTAEQMIEIWVLREGVRFTGVKPSRGGNPTLDLDEITERYVETTNGFEFARPCLERLRISRDASGDWWHIPGKGALDSARDRGWLVFYHTAIGLKLGARHTPNVIIKRFALELKRRIEKSPPVYQGVTQEVHESDPESVAIAAQEHAERKFPNRFVSR